MLENEEMKEKDFKKECRDRITKTLKEYGCDRYLIFAGSKDESGVFYKADGENDLVKLIVLGILEDLRDQPEGQEFLRTVLLSAVTADAYGAGWWDRLKKVIHELDGKGPKWFGHA